MPVILQRFLELTAPFQKDKTGPAFNPTNTVFDINDFLYVPRSSVTGPGSDMITYDDIELPLAREDMHRHAEAFLNDLCE